MRLVRCGFVLLLGLAGCAPDLSDVTPDGGTCLVGPTCSEAQSCDASACPNDSATRDASVGVDPVGLDGGGVQADGGVPSDGGALSERFTLSVEGAYGGGVFAAGDVVHLFGQGTPEVVRNRGFVVVSGNPSMSSSAEWRTALTMPASHVQVRYQSEAVDGTVSTQTFRSVSGRELTLRYQRVPEPVGILFLLHGTGGSSKFFEKVESRGFWMSAVGRGYTVVAPEAEEAVAGDLNGDAFERWSVQASPQNIDFQNLNRLVAMARNQGWADEQTPFYAVGMSNGGAMAIALGAIASSSSPLRDDFPELHFAAVAAFCATGASQAIAVTETPSAWYMAAQDNHPSVGPTARDEAEDAHLALLARGVDADFAVHSPTPLYGERFTRIAGIDAQTSRGIVNELRAAGFLDDVDMLRFPPAEILSSISANASAFPLLFSLSEENRRHVNDQLGAVYADHKFFADFSERALDFLGAPR